MSTPLDRLLPRASTTRMCRNLMVTPLLCSPPPWKLSYRPSPLSPQVYLYSIPVSLHFATRTVPRSTLAVSLRRRSCIVQCLFCLSYNYVSILSDVRCRRLSWSERLGHTMLCNLGCQRAHCRGGCILYTYCKSETSL